MPERQQMVLHLRYSGLRYAEIAAVLDMPVSSVGTTLARAEQAFRAAYPLEDR
jgi:RNA polymerase sigma-70 factor (ECF subfamily)